MNTQDFLVELGTEELPPKALSKLSQAFAKGITTGLGSLNLEFAEVKTFATPRRLAVQISDLITVQPDNRVEKTGPAVKAAFDEDGNPTKAASGFARSCGVEVSDLGTTSKDGVEKLFYSVNKVGAATNSLLSDIVKTALNDLPIPKRMRWGASRNEFVRPVHWCVLLYGDECIDTDILGVKSARESFGHRFHHNQAIEIESPMSYERQLENTGFVIADFEKRKQLIRNQVEDKAKQIDAHAVIDEDLLDEVTALVEYPVALAGKFDEEFLEVPPEALILAMKSHQKYFYLVDQDKKLLPGFISVSNIQSTDPVQVVSGNEKVIRPRLADARFFYETDLKTPLADRVGQLKSIVFQEQLGTVFDKSHRVAKLAEFMAQDLGGNKAHCSRAALLAKCDLLTNMVGEFADLQGLMGHYYALKDGEDSDVASAIVEQYLPRYAGDDLPQSLTGNILALAEKLDTIAGLFAIKQPPTGSKDPFAIRRAALGMLRILVENGLDLNIYSSIGFALSNFPNLEIPENTQSDIFDFLLERFKAWYQDKGIQAEVFQSVLALKPESPLDFDKRVLAVHHFVNLEEADALIAANKRVSNLLQKSDSDDSPDNVDSSLMDQGSEKKLHDLLIQKELEVTPLLNEQDYTSGLVSLASLKDSIDKFFDDVMVMSDDLDVRANRIKLLRKLRKLFTHVADVSLLHSS